MSPQQLVELELMNAAWAGIAADYIVRAEVKHGEDSYLTWRDDGILSQACRNLAFFTGRDEDELKDEYLRLARKRLGIEEAA